MKPLLTLQSINNTDDTKGFNRQSVLSSFKKFILEEKSESIAKEVVEQIQEYLNWLNLVPISKVAYLDVILSLARFLYRKEIGNPKYKEPKCIPVIREILLLKRKYEEESKSHPASVPFHLKSIPWEKCIEVVEKLRLRYEQKTTDNRSKRCKSGVEERSRTPYALARDLQDFLSVAFIVLIPPDRSRTFYELEIGRTLVSGEFEGRSFTPAHKLKNPLLAIWYIHLEMEDYKTGKRYGSYWAPVPNTQFSDGKTLYQYIDEWLSWGRTSHSSVDHNYFFRGTSNCKQLNHSGWNQRITGIFERETGVAVPPKEFRKMFVSYLKSNKASRAELEAARLAQHHSQKMQDQVYDYQEQHDKLQPIYDFNERVITEVLQDLSKPGTDAISFDDEQVEQQAYLYQKYLHERQHEFTANQDAVDSVLNHSNTDKAKNISTEPFIQEEVLDVVGNSQRTASKSSSNTPAKRSSNQQDKSVAKQLLLFD